MIRLETERLVIRNFTEMDWEDLHRMILQYEASGMAIYDQPWPTSAEEIKGVAKWFAGGDHFLAVCLKDTGEFTGFVALNPEPDDGHRVFNLGYIFNADYHGKGYAIEACRAVLTDAFDRLGAESVISGTAAVNTASCRLLDRLGFEKTAESSGSFRNAPDGTPLTFLGYSYILTRDRMCKTPKVNE